VDVERFEGFEDREEAEGVVEYALYHVEPLFSVSLGSQRRVGEYIVDLEEFHDYYVIRYRGRLLLVREAERVYTKWDREVTTMVDHDTLWSETEVYEARSPEDVKRILKALYRELRRRVGREYEDIEPVDAGEIERLDAGEVERRAVEVPYLRGSVETNRYKVEVRVAGARKRVLVYEKSSGKPLYKLNFNLEYKGRWEPEDSQAVQELVRRAMKDEELAVAMLLAAAYEAVPEEEEFAVYKHQDKNVVATPYPEGTHLKRFTTLNGEITCYTKTP